MACNEIHVPDEKSGAGDSCYISTQFSSNKKGRVPVPSSRKFNTKQYPNNNSELKLKLEKEIEKTSKLMKNLKKSKSVAEITPTKTKQPNRWRKSDAKVTLHATPRPVLEPPSGRYISNELWASKIIYQRLLLNSWRHKRERLTTLNESSRRQQEQIKQLNLQIESLNNLRHHEYQNRQKATVLCTILKGKLKDLETKKENIQNEYDLLKNKMNDLKDEIQNKQQELENIKNKNESEQIQIIELTNNLRFAQTNLHIMEQEKILLLDKISEQEITLKEQSDNVEVLSNNLKNNNENLIKLQFDLNQQENENNNLKMNLHNEILINGQYSDEIKNLLLTNELLENEINELKFIIETHKTKLFYYENKYAIFLSGPWTFKMKNIVVASWNIIMKTLYITLPALNY